LLAQVRHTNALVIADPRVSVLADDRDGGHPVVDNLPTVLQLIAAVGRIIILPGVPGEEFWKKNSLATRAKFRRR